MAYKRKRSSYSSRRRKVPYGRRRKYVSRSNPRQYISGQGDYRTWWGNFRKKYLSKPYTGKLGGLGSVVGGAIGTAIAPGIGTTVGGALGGAAGVITDRIMGWGDYKIKSNSLVIPSQAGSVPVFGKGSIRITHKEYIGEISSATSSFDVSAYSLNPGLVNSFPWLSTIAQNFEQYKWNGMVFQFVSTSADALNSTDTALGKVVLATDYNAGDPNFINVQQMMGTEFSNMGKPSQNIMHAIECDPNQTPLNLLWVRTGPTPTDSDVRLYDLGKFQIGRTGSQNANVIGDLWVSYDITLCKPVQNNFVGDTIPIGHWYSATGIDTSNYFGTNRDTQPGTNLGITFPSNSQMAFPANEVGTVYKVDYFYSCTTAGAPIVLPTVVFINCEYKDIYHDGAAQYTSNTGVNDNYLAFSFFVEITGTYANLTFTFGTLGTGAPYMDLVVTKVPADLL